MQRDSIDLRLFNVGLVSDPDVKDIPLEAQAEGSYNLDVEVAGKLKGIPMNTTHTSLGNGGTRFAWIERNDGKRDLIYTNGTNLYAIEDFYGTPIQATLKTSCNAHTLISNNQEVHVGCGSSAYPQWVGYISFGQFGGAAPSGIQVTNNTIVAPNSDFSLSLNSATSATEKNAVFPKGEEYEYALSLIYDGYQESPLNQYTYKYQVTSYLASISIRITIGSYSLINKRISGVRLYRRSRPFYDSTIYSDYQEFLATIANFPSWTKTNAVKDTSKWVEGERYSMGTLGSSGEYKMVADIDINDVGWTTSSTNKYINAVDLNTAGLTYESNVGIPESYSEDITSYTMSYGLSTIANNMLFISQAAYGASLTNQEAAHMIFRSKPYRLDTFNWIDEKLIMPTIPKAMKSHRGKLYVWDENTTYIIDPISFQIEKSITGRGCSSQESIIETDYGLFWANQNGVYWSTQTEELLQPLKDNLTEPIKNQYQAAVSGLTPKLNYNSKRNQLLVHVGSDIFAYNTVEKRWDFYESFTSTSGVFTGKNGLTYTVTPSSGILKDFGSTITKTWMFVSKDFDCDDISQDKKFYKLIRDTSGAVTVEYSLDNGDTWVSASENIAVQRSKTIKIRITGVGTNAALENISILFRLLRGKR